MDAPLGLEPRFPDPKTGVLPLDDGAKDGGKVPSRTVRYYAPDLQSFCGYPPLNSPIWCPKRDSNSHCSDPKSAASYQLGYSGLFSFLSNLLFWWISGESNPEFLLAKQMCSRYH